MKSASIIAMLTLSGLVGLSNARVIVEDFDGLDFNAELTFDFSSDFSGGDSSDHIDSVLWLYSDLADITVNTLAPNEWIESVEVTWTDFCGIGCTALELFGDSDNALFDNSLVSQQETVFGTMADLGEPITHFTISSFEGRFEEIIITVVPSPSAMAMLGMGGLMISRRRRGV